MRLTVGVNDSPSSYVLMQLCAKLFPADVRRQRWLGFHGGTGGEAVWHGQQGWWTENGDFGAKKAAIIIEQNTSIHDYFSSYLLLIHKYNITFLNPFSQLYYSTRVHRSFSIFEDNNAPYTHIILYTSIFSHFHIHSLQNKTALDLRRLTCKDNDILLFSIWLFHL